jgi:Zn-dependent M28 family amino/carboxypeptidase
VLSSHYDHLGVAPHPKTEDGRLDSIYNGARDNAIGTTAVIDAARYFAQHPSKRSMLFIAFTGEELGLVGSKYYAEHPLFPLKQSVYDLNIDNASYNDTTIITLVGLGRTTADADIKRACAAFNLSVLPDPTAQQWLFEGSDNLSLAAKGIPSPTFSLGMRTFDSTISNRYHKLSDEVDNFNLSYGVKFINAFILSAKYIADNIKQPAWIKGDKYEAAWKQLYR